MSHVFPVTSCSTASPFTGCIAVPGVRGSTSTSSSATSLSPLRALGGPHQPPARDCSDTVNRVGCLPKPAAQVPTIPGATQGTSNVRFVKSDGNFFWSNGSAIDGSTIGLTISDWADLDGDGDLDVVLDTGAVFANNGKGTFTREDDAYVTAHPSQLWSNLGGAVGDVLVRLLTSRLVPVLGDVNGDGHTDILFKGHLFLNDGAMRFTMDTRISALNQVGAASLADVDSDGGALRVAVQSLCVATVTHERTASA